MRTEEQWARADERPSRKRILKTAAIDGVESTKERNVRTENLDGDEILQRQSSLSERALKALHQDTDFALDVFWDFLCCGIDPNVPCQIECVSDEHPTAEGKRTKASGWRNIKPLLPSCHLSPSLKG